MLSRRDFLKLSAASGAALAVSAKLGRREVFAAAGTPNLAFILGVTDMSELGMGDTFTIQIPALNNYSFGGVIAGGNIRIFMR